MTETAYSHRERKKEIKAKGLPPIDWAGFAEQKRERSPRYYDGFEFGNDWLSLLFLKNAIMARKNKWRVLE